MSEEHHPNFHAMQVSVDVASSIINNLRNEGVVVKHDVWNSEKIKDLMLTFIEDIEYEIDMLVKKRGENVQA